MICSQVDGYYSPAIIVAAGYRSCISHRIVWVPAPFSCLHQHGTVRQHPPTAGLAREDRVGLRAADVSPAPERSFWPLFSPVRRRARLERRRNQLDAGLSEGGPPFCACAQAFDPHPCAFGGTAGESRGRGRRLQLALVVRRGNGRLEVDRRSGENAARVPSARWIPDAGRLLGNRG